MNIPIDSLRVTPTNSVGSISKRLVHGEVVTIQNDGTVESGLVVDFASNLNDEQISIRTGPHRTIWVRVANLSLLEYVR